MNNRSFIIYGTKNSSRCYVTISESLTFFLTFYNKSHDSLSLTTLSHVLLGYTSNEMTKIKDSISLKYEVIVIYQLAKKSQVVQKLVTVI